MTQLINRAVHVRFAGRSEEVTLALLDLNESATDAQIKQAIVSHFDLPAQALANHMIVRTGQALVVRPEALYG